jgi:DNA-binding response OmpR family regulator
MGGRSLDCTPPGSVGKRSTIWSASTLIELTPSEFEILLAMARNPGRVFSRLQLLESTQGQSFEGYERTVDAHIKNLRAKIEDDARNPHFIKTVFGIGYKFNRDEE